MQHAVTLVAALAALLWDGAGASPHASAFRRRDVPQIPGYDFSGCYTEATNSRALTGSAYFDDLMTVEKCAAACSGFKYFGVEYGRECYCGNTIAEGSVQASLADCSFACPGDATQNCGAGNRLDLFTRTTDPAPLTELGYLSRGCYAEPAGGRALTSQATRADDMTVEACATFCGNAGYALFGLEYYTECYCGNVLMPGAEPAADADCKYPCAGNANELCGGDWRLNLYEFGSSPTSTASTASSTPSVGPATYTSEGCYTEATGIRALSDVAYFDDAMTVEKCAAACAGYAWFGLEYGRECYGGNAINSAQGSVPTSLSECSFPCPGNPSQKCGAGDRLNMYRNSGPPSATVTIGATPTESSTPSSSADPTSGGVSVDSSSTAAAEASSTSVSESLSSTVDSTLMTSSAAPDVPSNTFTSTSSTEASTDSTSSSAEATTTSSEAATTSTSTSSSAASTTSSAPTNALGNGDFETIPGRGWTIRNSAPGALSYSFADEDHPHGGLRSASVAYSAGASAYQAWFNQAIALKVNTRYNFSGWTKASTANPGCSVVYYVGTADGNQNLKTLATITSANLKPAWALSTGFYQTGAAAAVYTFNVRLTCSGAAARTYYVDDLSLVEA